MLSLLNAHVIVANVIVVVAADIGGVVNVCVGLLGIRRVTLSK